MQTADLPGRGPGLNPRQATLQWLALIAVVAATVGSACAGFAWALAHVTQAFAAHPQWVWGLPWAGLAVAWVYARWGTEAEGGNNLLIRQVRQPTTPLPWVMAPFIVLGTLVSQLFGASVGREGTAVQMGAALADLWAPRFGLHAGERRLLLCCGMAAGFAALFGTPWAAAVFAIEVVAMGRRLGWRIVAPVLACAWLADQVALAWGTVHTHQVLGASPGFWSSLPWWLVLAVSAGALARLFVWASHGVADVFKRRVPWAPARPFLGGWLIVAAWLGLGLERHAGLGLNLIDQAFAQAMPWWESLLKAAFTAWSVGAGFKGGEVTPLFAMGALLGSAWGAVAPVPVPWLTALGLVAVFAGAARTPWACAVMAVELFGWSVLGPALLVCHLSARVVGPVGIYKAQAEPLQG